MADNPTPRLKLFHAPQTRSTVVRWMLEEVGEPYDLEVLDLSAGDQRKPEFLALNPMGKVPTLTYGDAVVSEAAAICCYLADAFPQATLAPAIDDPRRGQYLKWLFFAPSCLEPAMIAKSMGNDSGPRGRVGWADFDTVVEVLRQATANAQPYLLGEQFTTADVVTGAGLRWGLAFKLLPALPEFVAYTKTIGERPALQRQIALDDALTQRHSA